MAFTVLVEIDVTSVAISIREPAAPLGVAFERVIILLGGIVFLFLLAKEASDSSGEGIAAGFLVVVRGSVVRAGLAPAMPTLVKE